MPAPDLDALLAQVDPARLMAAVASLTRVVRTPGTDGEREAFVNLADALRAVGLAPVLHHLPAYVSLPVHAALVLDGETLPCTTHSMLPGAALEAELLCLSGTDATGKILLGDTLSDTGAAGKILLGDTLSDSGAAGKILLGDTRSGTDAAGKILLIDGLAMVPALKAAEAAGAAGVVFVAGSRHHHEMIVSPVWGSPEPKDLHSYLRLPAVTVACSVGEQLRARLQRGPCRVSLHSEVQSFWADLPVITADTGPVDKGYVLLTGHVDSWHRGAMDNASGNAAALEIARVLAPHSADLRRGLRVVFWSGHSHGRYAGSTAFCDAFFQDLYDNAVLHINADCLGAHGATLLTQGACMAETRALGDFALQHVTGERLEGTRFGRSCDQSLWGTGTPSLFSSVSEQPLPQQTDAASQAFGLMFGGSKSGGYGWWWHTEADTDDKLNPDFLQRDTRIFLAAVHKAVTDPVLPLDIRAGFADLAGHIREYAARFSVADSSANPSNSDNPDFAPLLADVVHVENLLARLRLETMPPDTVNRLIVSFEQRLVPLGYVQGSPFGHDPALPQSPLPLLGELQKPETDPHRRNAQRVLLRRRLNAVRHGVRELIKLCAVHVAPHGIQES